MATITDCRVAPAARGRGLGGWLPGWAASWSARKARRRCIASVAAVPEGLRRDVGLDGGRALARFENGGRSFVVTDRPDATPSGWSC